MNEGLERPADHFPVEQVQHERQVQPALVRPQILMSAVHTWFGTAGSNFRSSIFGAPRVRHDPVAALVAGTDAMLSHQALNTLLADRIAALAQFANNAGTAISAFEFGVDGTDHDQCLIRRQAFALRRTTAPPGTKATDAHIQCSAQFVPT